MEKRKVIINLEIEVDLNKPEWSRELKKGCFVQVLKELRRLKAKPNDQFMITGRSTTNQGYSGISFYKRIIPLWQERKEE